MDATATADFYELIVARHQKASTVLTSNRTPDKAHLFAGTCAKVPPKHVRFATFQGSAS
jgi:hypothetical protein